MPSRRMRRNTRRHRGGFMASVNDSSMTMPMRDSLSQGGQYLSLHKAQHGGAAAPYPTAVTNSVLTGSMVTAARTGPLDTAINQIQGMQDGGRRRKSRNTKRKSRKSRKSRNTKRGGASCKMMGGSRKSRNKKQRGGNHMGAPLSANSMLLPGGLERSAALHSDWSAAKDPSAFAPK